MQTFLPYTDYVESALCLDNKRLGKQRVECKQILLALGVDVGEHKAKKSSWVNHPAVKMWRGYEFDLCKYSIEMCRAWQDRGFKDTLLGQFVGASVVLFTKIVTNNGDTFATTKLSFNEPSFKPPWLGLEVLHASHRSNLLRKDADYYGKFGWIEPATLEYVWPV
jgi:hypothetical protein